MIAAMLLAIDIGNTNVTIGSFRNGALVATRRAATDAARHAPTSSSCCSTDCSASTTPRSRDVAAIACASVVPALTDARRGRRGPARAAAADRRAPAPCRSPVRIDRPGEVGRGPARQRARRRRACTARRRSSSTSARRRRSTASAPTARSSAARSRPGSSSGSRRSPPGPRKLPRVELRHAGPGDRPRHGQRRSRAARSLGYQALVAGLLGADPARARRRRPASRRGDVHVDPDRRAVGGALGAATRGRRRDRPRPDPQGPGDPARRGRRRRAAGAGRCHE